MRALPRLGLGLALLAAPAAPGAAQDLASLPTTARVAGVALTDVLNVRAAPGFGAAVLSTLEPDAQGIEVLGLSPDGAWARVPLPEGEGWVARRFLREEPGDPSELRRPASCSGTEPFWTLTLGPRPRLEAPGIGPLPLELTDEAATFQGRMAALEGAERDLVLSMTRAACSDGMSDRPYGIAALLWDRAGGRMVEGCCTLQAR